MRRRWAIRRFALAVITIFLIISCTRNEAPYRLVRLPSGKSVKILSVGKMFFTKGEAALMLKYQTDLPIADVPALERESDEIWESFRADVENAHLTNAIISASSHPSGGFVTTSKSYNFVYVKGPDGAWQRQPNR